MAIREISSNIALDPMPTQGNPSAQVVGQQPVRKFREISPDENIVLDQEKLPSSGLIGKSGDVLSDLSLSAGAGAVDLGNSAVNLGVLYGQVDPVQAADWIDSSNQVKTNIESGISPYAQRQMENISGADGFWDTTKEVFKNPYGTLNLTARNLSNSIPSMATAGAGAAGGAAVGTAIAPGVGTIIGGALGAVGGGFVGEAPIEIGSWVEQALQARGADLSTKEGRIAAYSNKALMDDVRGEAERKGLTTAAVDSVWNLFAGSKLAKTVGRPLPTRILAGAKDTGIQMAGGMASEAAGQTAAYKGDLSKVSGSDIALEGLLEAPSSIGEVAIGSMIRNRAQQEGLSGRGDVPPPDNGAPVPPPAPPAPPAAPVLNRGDLERMMNEGKATNAKNAIVQPETVKQPIAGTPEIGDTIEHIDPNGQSIKGRVDSIQEGDDGQTTLIVTDSEGNQNIVFGGDGETLVTGKRPLNRDDLLSEIKREQPKQAVSPVEQVDAQPLAEPEVMPQEQPVTVQKTQKPDTIESLQAKIDNIRAQAKSSGWNGMLKRREQEALSNLSSFQQRQIDEAAAQANPEPTEAQKESGNYKKGHIKIAGLDIAIENAKGSVRSGVDSDGEAWQTEMPAHYGYIKRTDGADGDAVDVYIGDNPDAQEVFFVDQIDPKTGRFDEAKVMIGFNSSREAGDAYKAAFSDGSGVSRVGAVHGMTVAEFKDWLKTGDTKKPLVYQEPAAPVQAEPEPIIEQPKPISGMEKTLASVQKGIDEKNAIILRDILGNLDNKNSRKYFEDKTGIKLPKTKRDILQAVDDFVGIDAKKRQEIDTKEIADLENKQFQKDRAILEKRLSNMKMDTGESVLAWVDRVIAEGKTKFVKQKKGNRNEYFLSDSSGSAFNLSNFGNPDVWKYAQMVTGRMESDNPTISQVVADVPQSPVVTSKSETTTNEPVSAENAPTETKTQKEPVLPAVPSEPEVTPPLTPEVNTPVTTESNPPTQESKPDQEIAPANETAETKASEPENVPETPISGPQDKENESAKPSVNVKVADKEDSPKTKESISDFGEKIEGAKKDLWKDYAKSIGDELPEDLKDITLSKHFPEPNYEVMIANGVTTDVLAAIKAMRDIIPSKPQKSWKLKEWASKVKTVRELSKMMLDGKLSLAQIKEKMGEYSRSLSGLVQTMELYSTLGYPAFTKAKGWSVRESRISKRIDGEIKDIGNRWVAASGEEFGKDFDTKEQAIDYIRSKIAVEDTTKGKKPTTFEVYRITKTGEVVIGKKIAAGKFINLKGGFKTGNEARLYMAENGDELISMYEKKKDVPPERRSTNDPRRGDDYRNGEDVSVETLAKTFGFRGIQFGNYVEQKRRAEDINNAYDAMKDMAAILGVPENALSLEGTLGLAFGARGGGSFAAAHYERGQTVINLTKKSGAGSLAHEWFHAFDHNFGKRREGKDVYITESAYLPTKEVRKEVTDAFADIVKAIRQTGLVSRSEAIDKTRSKDYWSTVIEMAARSFEAYIIYKAEQKGGSNDYLANVVGEDAWKASRGESETDSTYPYPTEREMSDKIAPAFDKLFDVLETKDTDKGIVMFSLSSSDKTAKTENSQTKDEIIAAINATAKKLGLPENAAVLFENLGDIKNVPNLEKASQDGGVVEGFYYKNLIYIAMTAKDYISTLNHEAVHYLKAAGAFTPAEWSALLEKAPKWREKYKIDKNYGDLNLTESKLDEEAIAHALQDYSNQGILTRVRNKIIKYFNMVKNVLTGKGLGYKSAQDIFDDIMSGEIGRRRFDPEYDVEPMFSRTKDDVKTNTPEFSNWFGDSKVVDADGKPLVVYHGTLKEFDEFKYSDGRQLPGYFNEMGFFFDDNPNYPADAIGGVAFEKGDDGNYIEYPMDDQGRPTKWQDGLSVYPVYLSINTPWVGDLESGKGRNGSPDIPFDIYQKGTIGIREWMIALGYDGVNLPGMSEGNWWIAFQPTQIKSVNNRGTFDENDDRIMFSRKKAEDIPMFSILGRKDGKKMSKEEQLQQAIDALDAKGLADKLRPSISKIASYILHPHQIASLYESFTPVYLGAIEMMKFRDVLVHKLSKNVHSYNKMNRKSKAKIDAVLEIGRLSKTNFKPNKDGLIVVKNEGFKDTVWSKDGDEITLSDVEVSAYEGIRAAMDLSLDAQIQTTLEEYGFSAMGIENKKDLIAALAKEGAKAIKSPSTIKQMQDALKIIRDIEDKKRKGYIPFKRWGEIGIVVRTKGEDAELTHFERVEIPRNALFGRKQVVGENKAVIEAVKRLREKYPSKDFKIHPFEMKDFSKLKADINLTDLDVLKASSEMTEEEWDSLRGMLSEAMQKRGYKQHFLQSNDVSGYSGDFERAINDYIVSVSGHLARRVHTPKLDAAVSQIEKKGEASLFEYARKYVSYITDPVEEWAAMRQMVYFWYLAGNVASGVTNSTQPLMVTAPWFKAMFSHGQIAKQMSKAYKDSVGLMTLNNGTDIFDFSKAPDDVRDALIRADAEGDFLPKNTHDAMAIADSNSSYMRGAGRRWRQVMDVTSLTFSIPERANRVVTYISAYRFAIQPENKKKIMAFIARDQLGRAMVAGKNGAEFAEAFSHYAVMSTQLRMGKLNRPTLSRGVGTLPFQFMSFSLQMLELMYRLSKVHGGKSASSVGMMLFAVVAMAGVKGIPFEDDLQKLFESAYKTMTRTDIDIDSEMLKLLTKYVGKTAAQAIVKGTPYALANLDMSTRLGYGNLVPDNQSDLFGVWFDMFWTKPVQATKDLSRGEVGQAFADVAPAFIRNPIQAYLWSEEGVKSASTGDTIIPPENLTETDIGMKMLGFTSSSISGERSRIYAEKRASKAVDELRSDYYDRLARAYAGRIRASRSKDTELMAKYADEIRAITAEKNAHNLDAPAHKKIIIREQTLTQRIQEEIKGAEANKPRKQARGEAEELKKVWGN